MLKNNGLKIIVALWALCCLWSCSDDPIDENTDDGTTNTLVTWNLYNFGQSKDSAEIAYIAKVVKNYDIVVVQEVSTTAPGAQAVALLDDNLDRLGAKWDYAISDITNGDGIERYAYLWKTSKASLKQAFLFLQAKDSFDREPYLARFEISNSDGQTILLANFHAVPTTKDPAKENALLYLIHEAYPDDNIMIMGDLNLSQKDAAFDNLKGAGFSPCITDQKTSLKTDYDAQGNALANEYDNIFTENAAIQIMKSDVIHFYKDFATLKEARYISDHIPVWIEYSFK